MYQNLTNFFRTKIFIYKKVNWLFVRIYLNIQFEYSNENKGET